MSRTYHHGKRGHIRIKSVKRKEVDLRRLGRALIEYAQAKAEAEAEAAAKEQAEPKTRPPGKPKSDTSTEHRSGAD